MSLFLGKIHYDLFKKIRIQEFLIQEILRDRPDLARLADENFGQLPEGELGDLVDPANIHGSLEAYIDLLEGKLSYIVERSRLEDIGARTYGVGEKIGRGLEILAGQELDYYYDILSRVYIVGMPCSRGMELVSTGPDLVFKISEAVYGPYYRTDQARQAYKDLKLALGRGILRGQEVELAGLEGDFYSLRRLVCTE